MACCTGQTKCNNIVTIGYLKNFIGDLIQNTAGTVVHVNSSFTDNTYCPTYSQLTNGSILPKYVDGGTNKGASNIDGITVNGTYSNVNELVKAEDLTLTFTRFKSITVSVSPTSISECGKNDINLGYAFKLTKTTKAMDNCTTGAYTSASTEVSDTTNTTPGKDKITYSADDIWVTISGNTASVPKNGRVSSDTRSTTVKASVTYKGNTHDSTPVTISQNALTGGYTSLEGKHATSITFTTITPSDKKLGCEGGRYTVSSTGNYYTRYRWKDSCDLVYDDVYQDTPGSEALPAQTGVFSAVTCPTETFSSAHTVYVTYSGITSSVTFTQNCSQQCDECESYTVWGVGSGTTTAPCTGGSINVNASVSGVEHIKKYVEGICEETTSATSQVQSLTGIIISANCTDNPKTYTGSGTTAQGGIIKYTITQPKGCNKTITYSWKDQTVSAEACDTLKDVTLSGTEITSYSNCTPTSADTISAVTVTFSANNTSVTATTSFTFGNATVTVNQAAGPCSCGQETHVYEYDEITVGCSSADSRTMSAQYTHYTYYSNPACSTKSERGANNITIPAVSCNSGAKRTISAGTSADTLANAYPKITQSGGCECSVTCDCDDVTFVTVATTIGSGATPSTGTTIARASYGNCTGSLSGATVISPASATTWLSAFTSGNEVRVRAAENTELSNERSGTVRTYYRANSSDSSYNCYKDFDVNQISMPCTCESLKFFITPIKTEFGSGGTHGDTILVASGDTFGCGTLSATTMADIFADASGNSPASLITEYIDEKHEKALFKLRVIEWGSNPDIKDWDVGDYRPANVNIFFKPKDESISACTGEAFRVMLYKNQRMLAECKDIDVTTSAVTLSCDEEQSWENILTITPKYMDNILYKNGRIDSYIGISAVTDSDSWLDIYSGRSITWGVESVYLKARPTRANYSASTVSPRTGNVNYYIFRHESGVTVDCTSGTVEVTQDGCTSGDCSGCSNISLSEWTSYDFDKIPASGGTYGLWEYVDGYSFCDMDNIELVVEPSASTYYTFDDSTGELTILPNETTSGASFQFDISLYRTDVYPYEVCSWMSVDANQEGMQEDCDCTVLGIYYTPSIQSYSAHTVGIHYSHRIDWGPITVAGWDKISGCGEGVYAEIVSDDDWITVEGFQSGDTEAILSLSRNDTDSARTATVKMFIVGRDGETEVCPRTFDIEQDSRCSCNNIIRYKSYSETTVLYGYSASTWYYRINEDTEDCISGYVTSCDNEYVYTSYYIDDNDYLVIAAYNNYNHDGCEDCEVTLDIIGNNGEIICSDSNDITLNNGCAVLGYSAFGPNGYGIVNDNAVSTGWTQSNVLVGTITDSYVGSSFGTCYSFEAVPQAAGYVTNIRFVPTTQTDTTNPVNYNIILDCIAQDDGVSHNIAITIKWHKEKCGTDGDNLGIITMELTPP